MPSVFVLSATVSYLSKPISMLLVELISYTYNFSISSAYRANACLRMIVPFPARGSGLAGLTARIISLYIFANPGAPALASSIAGLCICEQNSKCLEEMNAPDLSSECNKSCGICRIDGIFGVEFDEHSGLFTFTAEHYTTCNKYVCRYKGFLRYGYDLLAYIFDSQTWRVGHCAGDSTYRC